LIPAQTIALTSRTLGLDKENYQAVQKSRLTHVSSLSIPVGTETMVVACRRAIDGAAMDPLSIFECAAT
jgi:hypothetical protein